jgi:hypothetical protein
MCMHALLAHPELQHTAASVRATATPGETHAAHASPGHDAAPVCAAGSRHAPEVQRVGAGGRVGTAGAQEQAW